MNLTFTEGACLARGKETYACISLGFRNQNKCANINCEKGGMTIWQS